MNEINKLTPEGLEIVQHLDNIWVKDNADIASTVIWWRGIKWGFH